MTTVSSVAQISTLFRVGFHSAILVLRNGLFGVAGFPWVDHSQRRSPVRRSAVAFAQPSVGESEAFSGEYASVGTRFGVLGLNSFPHEVVQWSQGGKRGVVRVHVVDIGDSLLTVIAKGVIPAGVEKDTSSSTGNEQDKAGAIAIHH